jgi:hypothetical protein
MEGRKIKSRDEKEMIPRGFRAALEALLRLEV